MFIPASNKIEVKPLGKDSIIIDDKQELVELGEIVSIGSYVSEPISTNFYKIGDILAFEGWGATKIKYKDEEHWVVSTNENVILGKFTRDGEK